MQSKSSEDIIIWPCGTWCYRYELNMMTDKSDDFMVILYGTQEYFHFLSCNGVL